MNAIAAALGYRWYERRYPRGFEMRFSWAEFSSGWGFAGSLCLFEEGYSLHVHLGWPNIFIKLPFLRRWHREPHEMMESWGLSLFTSDVHLNWGRRGKIIDLPWKATWVRTSLLLADGTWVHETRMRRCQFPNYPLTDSRRQPHGTWFKIKEEHAWSETWPYKYMLRSGEVQQRNATLRVEEREWRWKWVAWLPFPRGIQRSIDVRFDDEVGERSGSWKGGCVGCGYDLRPHEMPVDALRRMEAERKF